MAEFDRDEMEPVAHVVQAIDTIICPENAEHLYDDTINILQSLFVSAINATRSDAERQRFEALREGCAFLVDVWEDE